MNRHRRTLWTMALAALALMTWTAPAPAQPGGFGGPQVVSPEVTSDRQITFRLLAPKAEAVRLNAGDIPGTGRGVDLVKGDQDVWEATVGPVPAGAYRYRFDVDGVPVVDPRNPITSQSNSHVWSLVVVGGHDLMDTRDVPHGAVAEVTYYSKSLKMFRRMHVYTPPGYESGTRRYPVFYLLHGAMDCDDSWSTVGRAGFILDNLIAAGKAQPMIVVMPAGHTRSFSFGRGGDGLRRAVDEFGQDFVGDIMPYVEGHYRVRTGRGDRAIAGLSMGGAQTLNIAFSNLEKFAYIGVFSSGIFGITGGPGGDGDSSWETQHAAVLDNAELKKGLRLVWFGTGKDDFLVGTSRATVEMLKKHGLDVVYQESDGGHTWLNWRDYLIEFAPKLFAGEGSK